MVLASPMAPVDRLSRAAPPTAARWRTNARLVWPRRAADRLGLLLCGVVVAAWALFGWLILSQRDAVLERAQRELAGSAQAYAEYAAGLAPAFDRERLAAFRAALVTAPGTRVRLWRATDGAWLAGDAPDRAPVLDARPAGRDDDRLIATASRSAAGVIAVAERPRDEALTMWQAHALGQLLGLVLLTAALAVLGGLLRQLHRRAAHVADVHAQVVIEADQATRSKAEFLANTSHELRTPLNAVIGYAELLATEIPGPLAPKQAEYVELIRRSGTHLLGLVTDILDLSKVEAGRLELHPTEIAARDVLVSCALLVKERASAGHLHLTVDADALPTLHVDAIRLKQILLHLLSNAVKFTAPGGTVTLGGHRTADGGVAFSVSDTGPGMTEAEVRVALDVFGQVDGGLERRHDGTGLGLPLARRLTELHGGRLQIDSVKARGTTVTVVLPRSRVIATPTAA